MDKTTKTILIVIGSIILLCVCGVAVVFGTGLWSFGQFVNWAEQNVSENPEVAVRVGSEIADFEVPDGFGSPYSIHVGEVTMVSYTSQNERSQILLAQFPEGTELDTAEMLRQMSEGTNDPASRWYNTESTLIEEKPVTIRGMECTLSINEGTSGDGITYRSATATFEGRGGPSLVLIVSPVDEWDIEMVETFIASIQ